MWSIDQVLPKYLREQHFELAEDEDSVVLLHEHEWIARYSKHTSYWMIIRDAKAHLEDVHGIVDHLELVNGNLQRIRIDSTGAWRVAEV